MSSDLPNTPDRSHSNARPQQSLGDKLLRFFDHVKREWQLYLMLLPAIIWFLVFLYKPMYGLQIAFKDYSIFRGVAASPWVGFEHFETLFSNDQFARAFWNTIKISALNLLFGFPAPILSLIHI